MVTRTKNPVNIAIATSVMWRSHINCSCNHLSGSLSGLFAQYVDIFCKPPELRKSRTNGICRGGCSALLAISCSVAPPRWLFSDGCDGDGGCCDSTPDGTISTLRTAIAKAFRICVSIP